ncbi:MAG: hypothetical protein EPGJADBJ_03006 [Saprospiraceae bacterium]|nr:hypothetical protein [Saprospiraceae bacterium]
MRHIFFGVTLTPAELIRGGCPGVTLSGQPHFFDCRNSHLLNTQFFISSPLNV